MKKDGEKMIIYTDGGSRGNPGPAAAGVVLADAKGVPIKKVGAALGVKTNNEAEYEAVILGLQKAKQIFGKEKTVEMEVEMRMDSQLIARQLKGEYKIEEERLFPLFIKIWNLRQDFKKITFVEIPREKNKEADALVNEALNSKEQAGLF